jgi:rhodanese-related sulfurtransferase
MKQVSTHQRGFGGARALWLGLVVVVVGLSAVRATHSDSIAQHGPAAISAAQLEHRIEAGDRFTLVDVREPKEYAVGHIAGAQMIPLGDIKAGKFTMSKDDEIVLYCHSGHRSGIAARTLEERGFTNVKHLDGGILKWNYGLTANESIYREKAAGVTSTKEVIR